MGNPGPSDEVSGHNNEIEVSTTLANSNIFYVMTFNAGNVLLLRSLILSLETTRGQTLGHMRSRYGLEVSTGSTNVARLAWDVARNIIRCNGVFSTVIAHLSCGSSWEMLKPTELCLVFTHV
ncbi:hypothetical protein E4T56_gene9009 [Termitomyces sp. T112]|nr:hypothetical protein E4T56_gene9009 [Termitomyces sp. T112]